MATISRHLKYWRLLLFGILTSIPLCSLAHECIVDSKPIYKASILVCDGVSDEIYTIYGHVALRLKSLENPYDDKVYNWGVFDFEAPHFISKFISGNTTDYMLSVENAESYIHSYINDRGTNVYELELNLTHKEIAKIQVLLEKNLQPENLYYHYNFIFDNCATRPFEIIDKSVNGELVLPKVKVQTR